MSKMIYFLFGNDEYRLKIRFYELLEEFKAKKASVIFFDQNLNLFLSQMKEYSMFGEGKIGVLENIFSNTSLRDEAFKSKDFFKKTEDTIIFYQDEKFLKSNSFYNFLKRNAQIEEYRLLEEKELKDWTREKIKSKNAIIEEKALNKLIFFVGNDLWRMSNEIEKLANFKLEGEILSKDVDLLVKANNDLNIFRTIDAIARKDKKEAVRLVREHIQKGESVFYLLSMINFQFRNLIIVKTSNPSNMNPFVFKKSSALAEKFSLEKLKKIYRKIFRLDLSLKTGKIEPDIALDLLISEI